MGMFGAKPRNPYDAPGFGMDGGFPPETMPENSVALPDNPFVRPQMPQAPQQPQPGMFGSQPTGFNKPGGWAERLGALGGVFLNAGGIRNDALQQFQDLQHQRQEEQRKAQLAEAARYAPQHVGNSLIQLNQQTGKYDTLYNQGNEPYRWRANNGDLMELGADGKPRVAFGDPTEKPNYEWVTDPTTGAKSLYQIPPTSRAPQGPPPGVTFTPLPSGGPTPQGSGTFR